MHEAFLIIEDDEDTTKLRQTFFNLIVSNCKEIVLIMNLNLDIIIKKYGNDHTLKNFKGRTPYIE